MHKLDRSKAPVPACLARYRHPEHNWDDVGPAEKSEIKASLAQMQGGRCAYCEGPLDSGSHIEHFRRKNPLHFPELTFAWGNLFLSCDGGDKQDHCGHYKDRPGGEAYNPADLVKPDEDDPDRFLYFHSSGEVRPRSGASEADAKRARETIRVFHLNCGRLKAERRRALSIYRKRKTGILEVLMGWDLESRRDFILEEIEVTRSDPYWTVIRHYFEKSG